MTRGWTTSASFIADEGTGASCNGRGELDICSNVVPAALIPMTRSALPETVGGMRGKGNDSAPRSAWRGWVAGVVYRQRMDPMAEPGDLIAVFSPQPGRCFRMVQSRQLQATHCRQEPAWKGQWRDPRGRNWYVEACRQHAPKLTIPASDGF